MKSRNVINSLYGHMVDMGGIPVRQPLPTQALSQIDPFLLFHHGSFHIAEGVHPLQAGVGPHPHRGFSPVTIVLDGEVHHRDSLGNSNVVGAGGVQWINAGKGIVHSERPSVELAKTGGTMEVIQLWVNTPASAKLDPAAYQSVLASDLPELDLNGGRVQVIAGTLNGIKGPIKSPLDLLIARIHYSSAEPLNLPVPQHFNAALYIRSGKAKLAGYGPLEENTLYHLDSDGDGLILTETVNFDAILIAGAPIGEPVANYGPFVMNNQTEIMEALRDYQQGKMGVLIEE